MIVPGDIPCKATAQQPPDIGHERLKAAERQRNDQGVAVIDAPHGKPLTDGHRKCIHRKTDADEQQLDD